MSKVIKEFRDVKDFNKIYKVGDNVEFDESRLKKLIELGLVEDDAPPVTDIDLTGKAADIATQVKVFTDVEKLKKYLETENASETPRTTVVKAIEARLANIVKE